MNWIKSFGVALLTLAFMALIIWGLPYVMDAALKHRQIAVATIVSMFTCAFTFLARGLFFNRLLTLPTTARDPRHYAPTSWQALATLRLC